MSLEIALKFLEDLRPNLFMISAFNTDSWQKEKEVRVVYYFDKHELHFPTKNVYF
jgi:hypothetical protein